MFVALETIENQSRSIFGGILNIITKPKAHIEPREIASQVYGVIVAAAPTKNNDWRKIAQLADRYGDHLLLPDGLTPPLPLKRAVFPSFERRVLLETATEIIKRTRMPMYKRVVGIIDPAGDYSAYLSPLLHHYTAVKVMSSNHELYRALTIKMMDELGAPVLLCDNYASFSDCVLVLSPSEIDITCKLRCPILAQNPAGLSTSNEIITDLKVAVPAEIRAACPAGIKPQQFIAALFEYLGIDCFSFAATQMTFRFHTTDLSAVVAAVMKASNTITV